MNNSNQEQFDYYGPQFENLSIYDKISFVDTDLSRRLTLTSLLLNMPGMEFNNILNDLSPSKEDTVRYCSNSGLKCKNFTEFYHGNFHKCFVYSIAGEKTQDEMFLQGMANGVTFVFMTGKLTQIFF